MTVETTLTGTFVGGMPFSFASRSFLDGGGPFDALR